MIRSIYSTAVLAIAIASIAGCRSEEEKRAEKLKADLKKPLIELYNDSTADLKEPSEQIYSKIGLAKGYVALKQYDKATEQLDLAQLISRNVKDVDEVRLLNRKIAAAYIHAKDSSSAYALIQAMPASSERLELAKNVFALCVTDKKTEQMKEILSKFSEAEFKNHAHKLIAIASVSAGKIAEGLEAGQKISDDELRAEIFRASVEAYLRKKNLKEAQQLLESMNGGTMRNRAQGEVALYLYRQDRAEEAALMVKAIESVWIRSATRARWAMELVKKRSNKLAKTLAEESVKEVQEIKDAAVRDAAIQELVEIFLSQYRTQEALTLARYVQSTEALVKVHAGLIRAYTKAGRFDEAEKMVPTLTQSPIWGAKGVTEYSLTLAKKEKLKEAFTLIGKIPMREFRMPALAEVTLNHSEANKKFNEAELVAFQKAFNSSSD